MLCLKSPDIKLKNISAHLKVIREATVFARNVSMTCDDLQIIHDLMDAIHNTPQHIEKDFWTDDKYLEMYYSPYDKQWESKGLSLVKVYKEACDSQ